MAGAGAAGVGEIPAWSPHQPGWLLESTTQNLRVSLGQRGCGCRIHSDGACADLISAP